MPSIADSDAYFDPRRMLPQHQAALTLLQGVLSNPQMQRLRWLDLACGRGQIFSNLLANLSSLERAKLHLCGCDISNEHIRQAQRVTRDVGLAECQFFVCELGMFDQDSRTNGVWDFISLTNTVHEISPSQLSKILVSAVQRLSHSGCLFIYDMDRLPHFELGAVVWTRQEIFEILNTMCTALGSVGFIPPVGSWQHSTCNGWNAQIQRAHMQLPEEWTNHVDPAVEATARCIDRLLRTKLEGVRRALEGLTLFGSETEGESQDKDRLLHDYWAISRALGVQL
ncbi:MAG: methylase involved in ubiquinone/menaquinone biosynthesis [Schlesneria sp.]|nr:methylase involved in ubiquinone/menaquinone biosynthesis [Schlesneria sp.]